MKQTWHAALSFRLLSVMAYLAVSCQRGAAEWATDLKALKEDLDTASGLTIDYGTALTSQPALTALIRPDPGASGSYLEILTAKNGFIAYQEGSTLHLDLAKAADREILSGNREKMMTLGEELRKRGLVRATGDYGYAQGQNWMRSVDDEFILVLGHPAFVKAVRDKAQPAPAKPVTQAPEAAVQPQTNDNEEDRMVAPPADGAPAKQPLEVIPGPPRSATVADLTGSSPRPREVPEGKNVIQSLMASQARMKKTGSTTPGPDDYEIMQFRFQNVAVGNSALLPEKATGDPTLVGQVSEPGVFDAFLNMAARTFGMAVTPATAPDPKKAAQLAESNVMKLNALLAARTDSDTDSSLLRARLSGLAPVVTTTTGQETQSSVAALSRQFANLAASEAGRAVLEEAFDPGPPATPPTVQQLEPADIPPLRLSEFIPPAPQAALYSSFTFAPSSRGSGAAWEDPHVAIVADRQSNTILVFDKHERRPQYERIRKMLDRPQRIVSITADILDVDVSDGDEKGADFDILGGGVFGDYGRLSGRGAFEGGLAFPTVAGVTNSTPFMDKGTGARKGYGLTAAGDPFGVAFEVRASRSTIISARIQALLTERHARLHSRPILVTAENRSAYYQSMQSLTYPGQAEKRSQLFITNAPFSITITPRVVTPETVEGLTDEKDKKYQAAETKDGGIYLDVSIVDGGLDNTFDTSFQAAVKESKIETKVYVKAGDCVVLGGRQRDIQSDGASRSPLLSRIPVLRHFNDKATLTRRERRYFVLTPKIGPLSFEDHHSK